jgi:asparagine synthase (glutamine-hydrolysing)
MCGLAGLFHPGSPIDERAARVARMAGTLGHRGPDAAGEYHDDAVSLGFRRLAVIDLATGQQPIRLEDDRAVIVLNGEIYNFRELREELEPRHTFRTRGDVEVVLRLYDELGPAALERLDGMFALAIWDRRRRTLLLARDRFGIKPLLVCRQQGGVAFASDLRALLAGGFPGERRLDPVELRHYLAQKYVSPSGSILAGVEALAPGAVLELGPDGERSGRLWEPPPPTPVWHTRGEASERLEELLVAAARRQLVADVPVGVFLSGGLDSSTLSAAVRRAEAGPLKSFSVGFAGPGAVSELPGAREVAEALGTEHHELMMDPEVVCRDLDRLLGALDTPLGDATALPTWYVSRLAREEVVVALSGEGADELFGGYPRQRFDVLLDRLGPGGRRLLPAGMTLAGRPVSARLRERLAAPAGLERQLDWSRVFTAAEIDALTAAPLADEIAVAALHGEAAARWQATAQHDAINARLEVDRLLFLPGDLLPKVDRMSMDHSLEVRVPFLDNALADFALALPGSLKVGWRKDKRVLRRVAERMLPRAVARRRKQGFDVPIGAWLRGALREPLVDLLSEETVRRRGLLRWESVRRLRDDHLAGRRDHGEPLWLLLVLEGWHRQVLEATAS